MTKTNSQPKLQTESKRLTLRRETLRTLSKDELRLVAGGFRSMGCYTSP